MILQGIAGVLILWGQLSALPEQLTITQEGRPVAHANRSDYVLPPAGYPVVDLDRLGNLIDRLNRVVHRNPVNATLDSNMAIVPERSGYVLDRRIFAQRFIGYMVEGKTDTLEAPQRVIYPKVDTELLSSLKEKMIGQYTTYFNSRNKNRTMNIKLAAEAINNQYVFPGETFSFNRTVGIRSVEKGYTRAKVIVRGEVTEGIGGGICQISSTLYNAVDRAGMDIVQRYSHSRHVPYVPPGRDATVSWYGPDFVFQNKYNFPVLIRAVVSGGQATVLLYSSETVNAKPRVVPSASKRLPEEVPADRNVNRDELP